MSSSSATNVKLPDSACYGVPKTFLMFDDAKPQESVSVLFKTNRSQWCGLIYRIAQCLLVMSPRLRWLADVLARVRNTVTTLTHGVRNFY